ncbi:hypothetical protein BC940DRAFT_297871 [Gongronella butleri]|nr:hypothetical protein BC940DRAFT_297871 [Gongronella butleri]
MYGKGPLLFGCCLPRPGIMATSFIFGCFSLLSPLLWVFLLTIDPHANETVLTLKWTLWVLTRLISSITYFTSCYFAYKKRWQLFRTLLYLMVFCLFMDAYYTYSGFKETFDFELNSKAKMEKEMRQALVPDNTFATFHNQYDSTSDLCQNSTFFNDSSSIQQSNGSNFDDVGLVNGNCTLLHDLGLLNGTFNVTEMAEGLVGGISFVITVLSGVSDIFFNLIPLLLQIYVVNKIRVYLNYVEYKKDAKKMTE